MARPTKLTPEITKEFERLLSAVPYWETAADYLGLNTSTVWRWIKRGERDSDGLYFEFCNAVKKARASSEILLAGKLRTEPEAWQRYAWMLERAWPDRWGRRDRVEVTLKQQAEVLAASLGDGTTAEELIAAAEALVSGSK